MIDKETLARAEVMVETRFWELQAESDDFLRSLGATEEEVAAARAISRAKFEAECEQNFGRLRAKYGIGVAKH
jgi:hypothetical protein